MIGDEVAGDGDGDGVDAISVQRLPALVGEEIVSVFMNGIQKKRMVEGCGNDDSDHLVVESAMIINDDFCHLVPCWNCWILVNIC